MLPVPPSNLVGQRCFVQVCDLRISLVATVLRWVWWAGVLFLLPTWGLASRVFRRGGELCCSAHRGWLLVAALFYLLHGVVLGVNEECLDVVLVDDVRFQEE